ncbi:type 1 glutamine amidotransferase [Ligilactobacillus equi]|uniref:Lipid II isoglutaminyl synthase (glutamine-hydrolyzing) subunit GatD n=1 Tax=Ligilactobacillus equi DSM 15833 = JCM 10991 TaxID=1423740 RepID=A0A0R1TPM4_9LACO|nr:glutamine amidotransferase [Ligilactobacillus equi]KRL80498.1 cobyric acid synthase [Ligilactobacillus equi DSM 15833 = JCM 10991]
MTYALHIAHLYGNLMNTYGDLGNILVLRYYAQQIGVDITSEIISIGQDFDDQKFDFVLFGGGQDFEQEIVSVDIQEKKTALTAFIENDGPVLAICGGFQLLGQYYIGANGKRIEGIGALPHYTESQVNSRFIGDIEIQNEETGEIYKGFENHNGVTWLGKNERPLGKVLSGHGNNNQDGSEGAIYKNTFCSYFHGPVLARNHNLAKRILITALKRKYPDQVANIDQIAHWDDDAIAGF